MAAGEGIAEPDDSTLILIENVSVWDGESDTAKPGQSLLVDGKLIRTIAPTIERPAGATLIDGGGRLLMPGIIDAHAHIAIPSGIAGIRGEDPAYVAAQSIDVAEMLLLRGWTTIRDVGGPSQGIARAIDEGLVPGPRIYPSANFVSQTSGHGDFRAITEPHPNLSGGQDPFAMRYSILADGPAEVRRAVREALRQGAVQIKLMAGGGISSDYDPLDTVQFSSLELEAAVQAAADWGTYVTVHAYTDDAVNRAIDAGVRSIEHGHLLGEKTLLRMRDEGIFLSSQSFGILRTMDLDLASERGRKANEVGEGVDQMMQAASRIGLPVAFGTDSFGSRRSYEAGVLEFGYRQKWFSNLEILRQATSLNARLLAMSGPRNPYREGPLGVIREGAYADLLIVEGDPLADVTVLEDHENNVLLVMKDGRIYKNTL